MSAPKTDPRVWLATSPAPLRSMVQVVKHADYAALRALYAEAVRALARHGGVRPFAACCECRASVDYKHADSCHVGRVLSRPEAQEVLRG